MYDGDHFMRKYMEIETSDKTAAIDYIDLESLKVNDTDGTWTIPHVGGIVQMNEFKANLGQSIYILIHNHNMPAGNDLTGQFTYGETYTFTLQPNEVRMFQISKGGDTTAPVMERAFSDGDKVITVRFNEKVIGSEFTVSGAEIESVQQSADNVTYCITLAEAPENKAQLTVTANVTDISGNACTESISMVYNKGNLVTDSLQTNYGFSVKAEAAAPEAGVLVSQGDSYALGRLYLLHRERRHRCF